MTPINQSDFKKTAFAIHYLWVTHISSWRISRRSRYFTPHKSRAKLTITILLHRNFLSQTGGFGRCEQAYGNGQILNGHSLGFK